MWEEVHPYLKFEAPQRRGVFHDSENGFPLQFGVEVMSNFEALMENKGGEEGRRKSYVGREEKLSEFLLNEERERGFYFKKASSFFFLKAMPYVSFWVEQKGPTFSLDVTHTQPQGEKNLTFWMLKSCLGLRVISLVPVPRVSLHPSGPVFESRQYIYQNAQNETLSVVQRLVLLNFKLHAKR